MGLKDEIARLLGRRPDRPAPRPAGRTPSAETLAAPPPTPESERVTAPQPAPDRTLRAGDAPAASAPPSDETRYVDVRALASSSAWGVLAAVEGDLRGQVFAVGSGDTEVGRDPGCGVVLASDRISRRHARIARAADGGFTITALSERNPVLVNGAPVATGRLADGDLVRLGRTSLRFRTIEAL